MREEQFRQRIMATFKVEAEEYVREILKGVDILEAKLEDHQTVDLAQVEKYYRQFHSLKGAAQAVGFDQVGKICQQAESILSPWKQDVSNANLDELRTIMGLTDKIAGELHIASSTPEANPSLGPGTTSPAASEPVAPPAQAVPSAPTLALAEPAQATPSVPALATAEPANPAASAPAHSAAASSANSAASPASDSSSTGIPPSKTAATAQESSSSGDVSKVHLSHLMSIGTNKAAETIRISSVKLDALLRRGEQLVLARINSMQRYKEARSLLTEMLELRQNFNASHLSEQEQSSEEGHRFADQTFRLMNNLHRLVRNLASDYHELDSQLTALLEEVKRARLAPVRPLLEELEIAARRIARQLGKKVRISIYGEELELDRSIMEALKDPLIHLVRNALDHGLESPEERLQANKPVEGHLTIGIRTHGTSTTEFVVADDGQGIQTEEVIEAAKRQGLIADGVEADTLDLIFSSGVSTRKQVSSISGRGLGMAIVRDKVEALKGSVRVKTHMGEGTTFELSMPTSFATFNGLLITEFGRQLVVPLNGIEAVAHFRSSDTRSVEGSQVVKFRDNIIPLSRLGKLIGIPEPPGHEYSDPCQAIIVTAGGRKAAFLLDEVQGVHEVLTRDLGPQLRKLRYIIGACMIGYQNVVPVLNVADLLTFVRGGNMGRLLPNNRELHHVLVVDDSLTTRTLMAELLENAGYLVTKAVDGLQAWEFLQADNYELLVSDVDMPGITGFDLTSKIRASRDLHNLPVILCTGKEKNEEKQRGLMLGASAYLLKSQFDEGVLLETVESLIGSAHSEE